MVHGFGGYFEAWLYKDITISGCPPTSKHLSEFVHTSYSRICERAVDQGQGATLSFL
jgi:hypothetical protein